MTELKTLKDIYVRGQLSRDNLKEEAIKWLKITSESQRFIQDEDFQRKEGIKEFIKHFFNLTEEDFK